MPPLPPKHGEMPHSQSQPQLQQPVQLAKTTPVPQEPVAVHHSPQTPVLGPVLGAPNTPETSHQPPAQMPRKDSQQEFVANRTAKEPVENTEGLQLIEKVYVRDQDGNTVELKTFLCPDGGTKTERRIAINSRGELQGKFKETGVDLNDVVQIGQLEINRLIQENTMKSAQKVFGNAITPTKDNVKHGKNVPQSGEKDGAYSPMQPFQFSTFQQPQATVMTPETQPQAVRQPQESNYQSAEKENLNKPSVQKPSQASPLAMKNQNLGQGNPTGTQVADAKEPASPSPTKKVTSTKEQATLNMPPSLANSIKGKSIKVRYKDFKGKTYPVAVSGPDLTKAEKEWLLRKIIEKEGLTIEQVEEIEGGHLTDADDGSEYRLTADKDTLHNDLANHSDAFSKNNRGSNLVKDIQNQIINEQDEELVSRSSVYTSNRVVGGQNDPNAAVQKFDLMHRPPESVNSRNDEIWFRTKEQKVIEDAEQYRHIDMSKSSNKSPMMAHYHDSAMAQMSKSRVQAAEYESLEKGVSTKFNYGTNQQYNPGFSSKYEAGSDKKGRSGNKEQEDEGQYDPSDIDALLKHNENLLSKIKIDMKNIGESFVSHTDMGSSRMGLKNSLAGAYLHRNPEFDSKDLINRSPIGIQEFESFKTKTHEVRESLTLGEVQGVQSADWPKASLRRSGGQRGDLREP